MSSKRAGRVLLILWALGATAVGQTDARGVARLLEPPLVGPDVAAHQLLEYLDAKAPALPRPSDAGQWTAEAAGLRRQVLADVVARGWPREWFDAPPKFEDAGTLPSGPGYRVRKLRYEVVPGFYSTAILYEPETLSGKAPAILNVNGHVGAPGKAVEYKQKRCITQARQGILSLNLEWLAYGELSDPENSHWFASHLDLVGANGLGIFYLAMRKGLDYLASHPSVDPQRLGVTGLSGGGWQTIVLSALDERVSVAVPVAGYASLRSRLERPGDVGDVEQNATDLLVDLDYPHLTAMRAPHPTLLIYNAEDDCCFRAPLVKPYIYDAIRPFFSLYGKAEQLAWHENTDPSDHNYQLDNRQQAYRFFARHFQLPDIPEEKFAASEILSEEELSVGLPPGNLTIAGLARKLASGISRGAGSREKLAEVMRYEKVELQRPWALYNTKNKGLETRSYRFDFSNGLSAAGVWTRAIAAREPSGATVVLADEGRKEAAAEASGRVNRGDTVIVADLLLTGDMLPKRGATAFAQLIATTGGRPLGLRAAQLIALAEWLKAAGHPTVRVEARGMRSQAAALVAAALEPGLFQEVRVTQGIHSFQALLDKPVEYPAAPELFCLDLYKHFDIDTLVALGTPLSTSAR